MHTVVPPLVHLRIFTHQNLAPNRPILIETISFQKNLHFFHLKNKFWTVWILVNTKGGTTFNAYCGPPFGPSQNFHSSKSCSKPSDSNRNYFLSEKLTFFSFKKQVLDCLNFSQYQRGDHIQCILWSPLWSISEFSLIKNLAPNRPILIETISFQKNLHFFHLKNKFWTVWILVNTKGGTTFNAYCGPPFGPSQNFHSSKSCSKPSDSNRNYFLSEKLTFFSFKKQVLDCLNFSQYQRGDHIQCILWSPLWSISEFSLIKILLQTVRF